MNFSNVAWFVNVSKNIKCWSDINYGLKINKIEAYELSWITYSMMLLKCSQSHGSHSTFSWICACFMDDRINCTIVYHQNNIVLLPNDLRITVEPFIINISLLSHESSIVYFIPRVGTLLSLLDTAWNPLLPGSRVINLVYVPRDIK